MVKAILQLRAKMQDIRSDAADADADGDSRDSGLLGMKPHDLPDEPCNRSRAEQCVVRGCGIQTEGDRTDTQMRTTEGSSQGTDRASRIPQTPRIRTPEKCTETCWTD